MAKSTVAAVVKNSVIGSASSAYTDPFSRPRNTYSSIDARPRSSPARSIPRSLLRVRAELAVADRRQHERVGAPCVVVVLRPARATHRERVEAAQVLDGVAHLLPGHAAGDLLQRRHDRHVAVRGDDLAPA